MRKVNLVITDLDDTIWDWQSMWANSFTPYMNRLSKDLKIPLDVLKADFKKLHQKYRTTEASFAFMELECIGSHHYDAIDHNEANPISILHEYNRNKKNSLRIFDTVLETLAKLRENGTRIIGFTESNIFFTKYRMKHLKLGKVFDAIYAPADHGLPDSVKRVYPADHWEVDQVRIHILPKGTTKPNPEVLLKIIQEQEADPSKTIYIGDKLLKDIHMANEANVTSVHATYGGKTETELYKLLREVTHWPDTEVSAEKAANANAEDPNPEHSIKPRFTIEKFSDLNLYFDFVKFSRKLSDVDKTNLTNIWKTQTEVSEHFNEIEMKIRGLAMTLFTFLFTAIGYSIKERTYLEIHQHAIHLGVLFSVLGVIGMLAFYFMDELWYHRLLDGSVLKTIEIEKDLQDIYPRVNLAAGIKANSPIIIPNPFGNEPLFTIRSKHKIRLFYSLLVAAFVTSGVSMAFVLPKNIVTVEYRNIANQMKNSPIPGQKQEKRPGVVLRFDRQKNFIAANETGDLKQYSESVGQDTTSLYFYFPAQNNRKELEEILSRKPISLD